MILNKQVGIIDYGAGNLASIYNAINYLGYRPKFITNPDEAKKFSHLILPGVGAFGKLAKILEKKGWSLMLKNLTNEGTYLFGICVGMQLLFESSEEGSDTKGVSLIKGRFSNFKTNNEKFVLPVPHMGFNEVCHQSTKIWEGIKNNSPFYFVHSFRVTDTSDNISIGTTTYGEKFISFVEKKNIFGSQFHPEKSHDSGLKLIKNFIELKID